MECTVVLAVYEHFYMTMLAFHVFTFRHNTFNMVLQEVVPVSHKFLRPIIQIPTLDIMEKFQGLPEEKLYNRRERNREWTPTTTSAKHNIRNPTWYAGGFSFHRRTKWTLRY
jgi:hypothetical protein